MPVTVNVSVTVMARPSSVSVTVTPNPVYQTTPDADGNSWFFTVRCSEQAGAGTQLTGFKIGGQDYSSQLAAFFGTTSLNASRLLRNPSIFSRIRVADNWPKRLIPSEIA
jgi:hypothetical protein